MEIFDDVKDLLHQNGGQAHGGLVQHQQLGVGHQCPAHGQHLLLAAGEGTGHLLAAFFQAGELFKDPLHIGVDVAAPAGESTHVQIFLHRHLEEDPPSLGDQGQSLGNNLMAGYMVQRLAHELDMAGLAVEQAGNGVQSGGLAGAVGTDQGHDLALIDLKGDALDGVDAAVIDVDIVNL